MTAQIIVKDVGAGSLASAYSWLLGASKLLSLALSSAILALNLRFHARDEAQAQPDPR